MLVADEDGNLPFDAKIRRFDTGFRRGCVERLCEREGSMGQRVMSACEQIARARVAKHLWTALGGRVIQ